MTFFIILILAALFVAVAWISKETSSAPEPVKPPVPGERWGFDSKQTRMTGSPWESTIAGSPVVVTIREVNDDWVRYYHGAGWQAEEDSVETLASFLRIFRLWE